MDTELQAQALRVLGQPHFWSGSLLADGLSCEWTTHALATMEPPPTMPSFLVRMDCVPSNHEPEESLPSLSCFLPDTWPQKREK